MSLGSICFFILVFTCCIEGNFPQGNLFEHDKPVCSMSQATKNNWWGKFAAWNWKIEWTWKTWQATKLFIENFLEREPQRKVKQKSLRLCFCFASSFGPVTEKEMFLKTKSFNFAFHILCLAPNNLCQFSRDTQAECTVQSSDGTKNQFVAVIAGLKSNYFYSFRAVVSGIEFKYFIS